MAIKQGERYRIRGTDREGMVMTVGEQLSRWAEIDPHWPFPSKPVLIRNADLERVKMRDRRGEDLDLPEALV